MTIATELAKKIVYMRYEDLPAEALEWARNSIIDTIGCAFAGVDEEAPRIVERALTGSKGAGPSLLWGSARRAGVLDAAEINGTAVHALDYDDCSYSLAGHPSVAILPGLLALGESINANGRDTLVAFVTGFETLAHVAHAVHMHHYEKGWHPTSTLGVFGAAAAGSRLLGLDAGQTARALSIAVSMAAGVKANFGSMTKPLHAGQCTRHGTYAAMLAKDGFTANIEAFEHKQGFFEVFNGAGNYDTGKMLVNWANPLDILMPGAGLKQYPCCAGTHSAIDAMISLREQHGLTPDKVKGVRSTTHARVLAHTNRPDPASVLDAKFSVQYCVARALMHGEVTFDHFEGESFRDPAVRELLRRVEARAHAHAPRGMDESFQCELAVTTTDGQTYTARVDQPLRGPNNLVPPDRLESKFRDCAVRALRPAAISRLYELLRQFDALANVRNLTDFMAAAARNAPEQRASAA
jgi:2-methylcitrate dehydratase PrpD